MKWIKRKLTNWIFSKATYAEIMDDGSNRLLLGFDVKWLKSIGQWPFKIGGI